MRVPSTNKIRQTIGLFSLAMKIKAGFGAVLLLTVLVATLAEFSIVKVGDAVNSSRTSSQALAELNSLSTLTAGFRLNGDLATAETITTQADLLQDKLAALNVADAVADLEAFRESVVRFAELEQARVLTTGQIEAALHVLRKNSNELETAAESRMLQLSDLADFELNRARALEGDVARIGDNAKDLLIQAYSHETTDDIGFIKKTMSAAGGVVSRLEKLRSSGQITDVSAEAGPLLEHAKAVRDSVRALHPKGKAKGLKGPFQFAVIEEFQEEAQRLAGLTDGFAKAVKMQVAANEQALDGSAQETRNASRVEAAARLLNDAVVTLSSVHAQFQVRRTAEEFDATMANLEAVSKQVADLAPLLEQGKTTEVEKAQQELSVRLPELKEILERKQVVAIDIATASQEIADTIVATSLGQADAAADAADFGGALILAVGGMAVLAGIMMAFALSRATIRPIKAITGAMTGLAQGDLAAEITGANRADEIGEMARAVAVFKDTAIERQQLQDKEHQEQSRREEQAQHVNQLIEGFRSSVSGILNEFEQSASDMNETADTLSVLSSSTRNQAVNAATAASQSSANMESVAAATDQLSNSVSEITERVVDAKSLASQASGRAKSTTQTVNSLKDAADGVGAVVSLIQEIAEKTNLLALNATIEAARVGEAGKGFAVVANEVKQLANQTSKATEEIGSRIGLIQGTTDTATEAIAGIVSDISALNDVSLAIAAAVEEQHQSTNEISRNIQEAASGTREISETVSEVSSAAQETGTSVQHVVQSTKSLQSKAQSLGSEIDQFLQHVR